jgi:hypothetical protein
LGYIEAGMPIGTIRSWIVRKAGDPFWYWEFDDHSRGGLATFYVPHDSSILNLPQLEEDYNDAQEAERRAKLDWWGRTLEQAGVVAQQAGSNVLTGALLLGGIYIAGRLIINRK